MKILTSNSQTNGSATVLLILMLSLLMGAISFSIFTGQLVNKKIEYQNAADVSMKTVAGHGGQGLNLIASNNLAIAASIHMSALVPVAAHYISPIYGIVTYNVGTVAAADLEIIPEGLAAGHYRSATNKIQNGLWNKMAFLPHLYMGTAVGLTSFNQFLSEKWLVFAHSYFYESVQLNSPHSLGLNWQRRSSSSPSTVLNYQFDGLAKMDAKSTFCSSIRASEVLNEDARDNLFTWFSGIFQSVLDAKTASKLSKVTDGFEKMTNQISKIMLLKLGFVDCGYGIKGPMADFAKSFTTGNVIESLAMDLSNGSIRNALNDMGNLVHDLCKRRYDNVVGKKSGGFLGKAIKIKDSYYKCPPVKEITDLLKKAASPFAALVLQPEDVLTYEFIREMNRSKSAYSTCEGKKHHLTAKLKDRSTFCLNLHAVDPLCAFGEEMKFVKSVIRPIPGGGSGTADSLGKWISGDEASVHNRPTCQAYKQLFEDSHQDFSGFQIVDLSQQVDHFVQSAGPVTDGRNPRDSLAFTYIKDEQAFAESRCFYGLLASAEGWTYERNDQEIIVKEHCSADINNLTLDDGTVLCKYNQFVHAFNNLNINKMLSSDSETGDLKVDLFSQVHTRNLKGYLSESSGNGILLQQAIFNQAKSRIHFESLPDEGIQDSMFWPNWKGQLSTEF